MRSFALFLALLVSFALPGHTTYEGEFTCPLDGKAFTCLMDGSGTSFGKRLDFKPYGPMPAPWRLAQCPQCGFVLFKDEFSDQEIAKLKSVVGSQAFKDSAQMKATYYCLAEIRRQMKEPPFEIGFALLQASWQVEADSKKFSQITQEAIQAFDQCIAQGIQIVPQKDEDADIQPEVIALYLLVELNRIQGRFEEARGYLLKHDPIRKDIPPGFNQLFAFQKALVAKSDPARRTMSECAPLESGE